MKSLSKIIKDGQSEVPVKPYEFHSDFFSEQQDLGNGKAPVDGRTYYDPEMEMMGAAKAEADTILEDAYSKSEAIKTDAYEEGYKNGYEDGSRKAYEDHQFKLNREITAFEDEVVSFIEGMQQKKDEVLAKYIDDLKKISMAVAEKIIRTNLSSDGDTIKRMILSATDKLKKTEWAKVYISAADSNRMVKGDADIIEELSHLSDHVKVVAMENEEEGNCIIELPDEIIDVSINTQLQNIKDILNNARLR